MTDLGEFDQYGNLIVNSERGTEEHRLVRAGGGVKGQLRV
jgi:hypothetical protein